MPKYFSATTRKKLSEAMKRQWAIRKSTKWPLTETNGAKPSLRSLFAAAVQLSTDDGTALKRAIADCAKGETLIAALEAEKSEGTNLQSRMRKQLTTFIQKAL